MGAKIQSHVSSFFYFWIFLSWYNNSLIFMTLIIYPLCCLIYVYSFGLFPIFLSYPCFLCQYPCFIFQNLVLPFFLRAVPRAVRKWGGVSLGWRGGIPDLLYVFIQAVILTCQSNSWFQIPVRLPFLQGTGELSSADHSQVGPRNADVIAQFSFQQKVWERYMTLLLRLIPANFSEVS